MSLFSRKKEPAPDYWMSRSLYEIEDVSPFMRKFLEKILDDAPEKTDPEIRDEMVVQMAKRLDKWLVRAIADALSPEERAAFLALKERGASADELNMFVDRYLPDPGAVFTQVAVRYRNRFI